jgi:Arc/MetJ-type ribon-helix-helix transcriptional regulator
MSVIVQVQLSDDLKSAIDRQIAAGHAQSLADFLREAARLYAEALEQDEDLWALAQAGIADAEAGRYTLVETDADAEALHRRVMAGVRASLACEKGAPMVKHDLVGPFARGEELFAALDAADDATR